MGGIDVPLRIFAARSAAVYIGIQMGNSAHAGGALSIEMART